MKKSIILAMCMALPGLAGQPAPVTVAAAPVDCPLSLEVAAVYTAALNDVTSNIDGINTWGVDVTALYDVCPKWAITLRGGWAEGEADNDAIDTTVWSIMPGVRYTSPIKDKLSWFAGANIGLANVEYSIGYYSPDEPSTYTTDEWGFAYSAEIGLRYNLTEHIYVFGAAQGNGNFAEPSGADCQYGLGGRVGLGIEF